MNDYQNKTKKGLRIRTNFVMVSKKFILINSHELTLTAHNCQNNKVDSLPVPAIKFIREKQLV